MGRKPQTALEKQLKQQLRDLERDDKRGYEILFIVWEPLCYDDTLIQKLTELGVPMFVGCIHDSDVNSDGEIKKAHRHCGAKYSTKKYLETFYSELKELFGTIKGTVIDFKTGEEKTISGESCYCISYPQLVKGTFSGAVRYTKHIDNPDKFQYSEDPIGLVGLDTYEYLLTSSDEVGLIKEICSFIIQHDICYPEDFIVKCSLYGNNNYLSLYTRKKTYLINSLMSGRRERRRDKK